jgi:hypothetical protein
MRAITFLGNLISAIGQYETSLSSIRISTNRTAGIFIVRYELDFTDQIYDIKVNRVISSLIRSDVDGIYVRSFEDNNFHKQEIFIANESLGAKSNFGAGIAIEISDDGYRFDLTKLKNWLTSKTFYGLHPSLRKHIPANKIKIYYGAGSYQSIDINPDRSNFIGGVKDGIPFGYFPDHSRHVKFLYLNEGVLCEKKVSIDSYINQKNKNEIDRFKIKIRFGLQIHSLFMFQEFNPEIPLSGWSFLDSQVNSKITSEISLLRSQQVERLTTRMNSMHQRRKVSISGVNLGVEPKNEIETVLLFERAFPYLKNLLPDGFLIRLLDYSPRDIDAVCEFTPSVSVPSKVSMVEFEYDLKSFFDHGHDLRQVNLIICYKMDNIHFPYNCFGSIYSLDPQEKIMILRDMSDIQVNAHCLILNRYLTVG